MSLRLNTLRQKHWEDVGEACAWFLFGGGTVVGVEGVSGGVSVWTEGDCSSLIALTLSGATCPPESTTVRPRVEAGDDIITVQKD
jgi:hypothetical protein